jgi:hypothetical protein
LKIDPPEAEWMSLRSVLYIVDGSTPFLDPDALDGKNTTPAMRGAIQPELMSVSKASGP